MIIEFSKTIQVEAIGFCKAEKDATHLLSGSQSFIVILQSYDLGSRGVKESQLSGTVSRAAVFQDYHILVKKKLEQLRTFIRTDFGSESLVYCDQSPFSDRAIAVKAGLGVIGKNSFLMNKRFGTASFIGYLLTDIDIQNYDEPLQEDLCGACNLCVRACPNEAILPQKQIEMGRCISYLTQSKVIDANQKAIMNKSLYGCDICQLACPYNSITTNSTFEPIVPTLFNLEVLLKMDNKTFKDTFGKTASGWRGKKTLQRNAIIALSEIGSNDSVCVLQQHIKDCREDIRMEIVQALGRIGSNKAQEVLKEVLLIEKSEIILAWIQTYMG